MEVKTETGIGELLDARLQDTTGYLQRELTVSLDLLMGKFDQADDALSQYQDLTAKLHDAVSAWDFSDTPWMLPDKMDDEHKENQPKHVIFIGEGQGKKG